MKKIKILFCIAMFAVNILSYANDDKCGSISTIEAEYDINSRVEIATEWELRTQDYLKSLSRWSSEVSISYKIFDFLKIGNGYSLLRFNHEKRGWETGYRFYLSLTASHRWRGFKISLDEKYQQTYRRGVEQRKKRDNPKKILKTRLKLKYSIGKTRFSPFISYEWSHDLKRMYKGDLDKTKFQVGVDYEITNRHSVAIYFRLQKERIDEEDPDMNVLGIGYKIKL